MTPDQLNLLLAIAYVLRAEIRLLDSTNKHNEHIDMLTEALRPFDKALHENMADAVRSLMQQWRMH